MTKLEEYAKRLGVETSSTRGDTLTDINAGKAGYNQYLADVELFKKTQEETQASVEASKSWWDKASDFILRANGMSSQMSDNPITSGFNAAVEAYKNIPEDNKPSDDWTDEERWAFGEKYSKDKNDAYSFAKQLNAKKTQEKREKQAKAIEKWTNRNPVNQVLGSAASLGLNATAGSLGFLDSMAQMAGRGEIQQHDILLPHEVAGTMQEAVASDLNKYGTINEKVPILGGKGWGDVYGLGMSIAQSKLAATTGGGVGSLAQFFGMSASQGVSDALERGATGGQALAFGTVSGLAEAIPEMISLDKFIGIASSEAVESVFKNVLKMAGEEAGEELTTSLITEVADRWIMGGKSEFQLRVNELVASGMSIEEAKKAAWKQTINNIAFDTLSGAISGGVSGALGTGINRFNQRFLQTEANETAKKALTPESKKLIEEGKKYDTTKKRAEALEKKLADGKELNGYDLRMLANQVNEASRTADVDTVRKAIVEQMKTEGVSESQAKALGEIALNKAIGNDVSKVQELMLKRNAAAMKVYNQISAEVMESGMGESEWAEKTPLEKLRAEKRASEQTTSEQRVHSGIERLKDEIASRYGVDTKEYKINMQSIEGKFGEIENKIVYKPVADSKLHVDGISSSLTQDDIIELSAIEKIANELGIHIHVYETTVDENGERSYVDKDGMRTSDSGYYDPNDNSIHIDLRAGEGGEGTMLYTASHEVVHFIKENADEHYAALEELVTKELVKGGMSIEKLINAQKDILKRNGWTGNEDNFEDVAREEMVAEACQSFLASKSAVAEIKALKTKNKGLWTALKKFFTSLFTKLNKVYKTVDPDSIEGKYIADMRGAVKNIRDAFMEGAVEAGKKANAKTNTTEKGTAKEVKSQARVTSEQDAAYLDAVKRGDMETAQRMVDEAAEAWGGDNLISTMNNDSGEAVFKFYRSADGGKTVWTGHGNNKTPGVFLTSEISIAKAFDKKKEYISVYAKAQNVLEIDAKNNIYTGIPVDDSSPDWLQDIANVDTEYDESRDEYVTVMSADIDNLYPAAFAKDFDAVIVTNVREGVGGIGTDVVLKDGGTQIKSADPVTYDDNGNVIPLSERFNEKSKDIRHKARSITTKDSLGNELSAEQQEYFKDSAVRDKKGNLLVLYHGTTADFNTFKKGDVGFHFGTKGAARGRVGYGKNVNLKEVYLNITNPIVFDEDLGSWDADFRLTRELYERGILTWEEAETVLLTDNKQYRRTTEAANKKLASVLQSKGYDGISYTNTFESKTPTTSYIIFDSNQAKLITNTEPTLDKDIRHKSRSYTAGQVAAMNANLRHQKVYTKSTAMKFVKAIAPNISAKSFDKLSNELWIGLNTYTSLKDKRDFAKDMADMIVDRMLVDTEVKNRNWDEAVDKIAYLKPAINTIKFREEDLPDLEHMLDKNGLRSLRARWGYKSREGENKREYGLDEFITDLSREMPGMAYLADMHPTEAMVEVDKLYEKLKETIKQKYESAYEDATEEQITHWKSTIEAKIIDVYDYYGGMSRMLQATSSTSDAVDTYLSTVPEGTEKPEKYFVDILKQMDERISYWKAEKSKAERISRWNGIIANKALEIRDFKNGAFLNATQYHPDVFKNSIEELTKVQWRGNISPKGVRKTFAELKKWYTMDNPMLYDKNNKENNDDLYSDAIAFYIDELAADADIEKPLSADEYPMIYEVMNHLYTMMKNYGKIFRAGRWVDAADIAKAYIGIIDANDKKRTPWTRVQSLYNRQFLEPMALARQADNYNPNGFFTQTVQELRQASVDASVGEMKLRKEYDEFVNANQKYLMNAAKETVKYRGKDIPKLHLISLYMSMKRKQSREGLALNGFEYTMKTAWWDSEDVIKVPGYLPQSEKHNIDLINRATEEQMKIIAENFTDTDRQYMAILEKLFNEKLREMKIERDMERQGYTNALEGYYYPIIRGGIAKNVDTAKFTDVNRATNSSLNKSTQEHAQQYLKIISADAMVNRHIKDMCKYYYMSQAIENYNVLYQIDTTEGDPNLNNPRNIAERLKVSKIWEKDFDYFKKLVADIQGIRDNKYDSDGWRFIETIRGNYAKFALGLNAKVLFTQISSVIAAGDVIGFGSIMSVNKDVGFVGTKEDIAKYCPIADVRSYEQTALKAMTLSDKLGKVSEKLMIGISVMDDLVVRRLYAACQVEAKKRGEGEIGSEENKIVAGKILEQIIIETQQNSYATEKSSAMRSANPLWRGLTMFTADGMKVISRIHEAAGEFKIAKNSGDAAAIKKARKKLVRSIAVAATISVYLAAISTLFNWIYDRDEEDKDDKPIEKVFRFSLDVVGNFIGALPGISDFYDRIVNGFEVEDVAYDTFNNLFGSLANLYKDATDMRDGKDDRGIEDLNRDLRSLLYAVGQVTGMPVRNVYNLARGLVGKASPKAAYYIDSKFNETSLINDLKKSLQQGNDSKTSYIMSLIYDERLDERVSAGQSKEISRLYEKVSKKEIEGYSILPRDIPDEIKKNGKTYELSDEQKEKIISEYSKVITAIDKLIASSFYLARSDKDRAYLIDYYHDKYYETAVNNVLKIKDDKVAVYNAVGFSTYAKFAYATRGIESDKDKNGNTIAGSKKANIIEAINKISNNEDKKLLYLASLGYSLSDEQKKKLCKYLNSLSISASKKKSLAEICNFTYKKGKIYP